MTGAHPDDELLSAHLDGEAPVAVDDHLGACGACRARSAELESVAAAVGAVPEPGPGFLDAAIAAAAAAAAELDDPVPDRPPAPAAGGASVTDLARARRGEGAAGAPRPERAGGRHRWPPVAWVATAAAAVALLGGVAQLVPRDGSGGDQAASGRALESRPATDDAGGGTAGTAAGVPAAEEGPAVPPPHQRGFAPGGEAGPPAVRNGGDLGDQSDPATLAALVDGAAASALRSGPDAVTGGGAESDAAAAASSAGSAAGSAPFDPADPPCLAEAGRVGPDLGPLLYVATVRWRGTPAVVLVFRLAEPAGGFERQLYVMSRASCALLAEPRL